MTIPKEERANLFPNLVNSNEEVTRHEFVGFAQDEGIPGWRPMFRCTETGADRQFGYLNQGAKLVELYGTSRLYLPDAENIK